MRKILPILLTGVLALTVGCGQNTEQKSESNHTTESDAAQQYAFEEDDLPQLLAVSDGTFYTMTGSYGENAYRLSVSEAVDEQDFVYETDGVNIWYLYADGDWAAWTEWADDGYDYKIYDRKADEVRTVQTIKAGEDEAQNMQIGLYGGKLYYCLNDYQTEKSSVLSYDLESEKTETVYETDLSENGTALSVNDHTLTAYLGEGEGLEQRLIQIDLEGEDKKEIQVPGQVDALYALSYDQENDLLALYYHESESETEDIGTFAPGDQQVKSLYSMPENVYAYHDRIDIRNGILYWVTQTDVSGDIVDHYSLTQYDCKNDKPQEHKRTFGYALADETSFVLSYGEDPSVVIVNVIDN